MKLLLWGSCGSQLCSASWFAYFVQSVVPKIKVDWLWTDQTKKVEEKLHTLRHQSGSDGNRTHLLLRKSIIMLKERGGDGGVIMQLIRPKESPEPSVFLETTGFINTIPQLKLNVFGFELLTQGLHQSDGVLMFALCLCSGSERSWRRCWTWRVVCWGRCRGASRWGAEGSRRPPPAAPSHTALTPYHAGESPPCTHTHLGSREWSFVFFEVFTEHVINRSTGVPWLLLLCCHAEFAWWKFGDAEHLNPSEHTGWQRHGAWTLCLMILEVGLWRTLCFCF